jgi:hypothetical protein
MVANGPTRIRLLQRCPSSERNKWQVGVFVPRLAHAQKARVAEFAVSYHSKRSADLETSKCPSPRLDWRPVTAAVDRRRRDLAGSCLQADPA